MIRNNPLEVILALDHELDHEVSLVLYGRAALGLGFDSLHSEFQMTQDVDAIISFSQMPKLMDDHKFWDALEKANKKLEPSGLYMTHLFSEDQVFLRHDWEKHMIPLVIPEIRYLKLYRPHAIDLILSKMMRGNDDLDMADIAFIASKEKITGSQIEEAFSTVRIPDIPDFRDAFARALPTVREIIRRSNPSSDND
jgi:hypothetical protein